MKYIHLVFSLLFSYQVFGQFQNNQWIFGYNARVDFSGPTPLAFSNASLVSNEATASVSDPNTGQLLFYSDGVRVWNANNQLMPNGSNLAGGFFTSCTQGAMIVPFPDDNQRSYLFTLDELEQQTGNPVDDGLRYSVVNMALNGGLGDVEAGSINIPLATNLTEKLIVIRSTEIQGFWIIAHRRNANQFLAWKIDACGVSPQPVVSTVGSNFAPIASIGANEGWAGAMDASPDGNRIAMPIDYSNRIEFFNFDKTTGILSNPITVNAVDNATPPFLRKYGACFSPDGSKFYYTNTNSVYQLNLSNYTAAAISASLTLIYSPLFEPNGFPCFQIEQAPNNKLYVAIGNAGRLDEISNPNAQGLSCGYVPNAITFAPATCQLGLPPQVPQGGFASCNSTQGCNTNGNLVIFSNYDGGILNINVDQNIPNLKVGICTYEPIQVTFTGAFVGNITEVIYAGMNSNQNNNNCGQGNFTTSISGVPASIVTISPPMNPPPVGYTPAHGNGAGPWGGLMFGTAGLCDTTITAGGGNTPDEIVYYFVNATGGSLLYHYTQYACWLNETRNLSAGGNCCINPTITNPCPTITVSLNNQTNVACPGEATGSASFSASGGTAPYSYTWSPGSLNGPSQTGLAAGVYTIQVLDANNCPGSATVNIIEPAEALTVSVASLTNVNCNGENDGFASVTGSGGTGSYTYSWTPGNLSGPTQDALTAGTYLVQITDAAGCIDTTLVNITEPPALSLSDTISPADCGATNGAISVTVTGGTTPYSYAWVPTGNTGAALTNLSPGTYTLTVSDASGCTVTENYEVETVGALPVTATPDTSTIIPGESVQLNATGGVTYSWNPSAGLSCSDCPNPVATPSESTTYLVTGADNVGCSGTDTVIILISTPPILEPEFPNVITPNGDGVNDFFAITNLPDNSKIVIYNRWGAVVFSSDDYQNNWEGKTAAGKNVSDGVYYYVYVPKTGDGGKGLIHLIR